MLPASDAVYAGLVTHERAGQRAAAAAEHITALCRSTQRQSRAARAGHPGDVVQALQACPDVDRSIGRAFLQRIKPSEFCVAMSVMSGLPARLISAVDGVGGGKHGIEHYLPGAALLLHSCLQAACDSEVRRQTPCPCLHLTLIACLLPGAPAMARTHRSAGFVCP